jgi:replicative DNA helicase
MTTTERTLPGSVDAERAILGAILLENLCYDQAASQLEPQDFTLDSHRRLWVRMIELAETGKPIDFVTLTEQLGLHKEIESVGGVAYVTNLTDGLPRVKNIGQYVRIVKEKATLRQIIHLAEGAKESAYEQDSPASQIMGTLQENILTLLGNDRKGAAAKVAEFSQETWDKLIERRESPNRLVGLSTGLDRLDERTTGIRAGEFWTIGGRTGDGKTSLALQIAAANASQGIPVGFFSLEMDRDSLLERLWSGHGEIRFRFIRNPKMLSHEDGARLARAREEVDAWPLFIEDNPAYTISEIEARSRLMIRQRGIKLVLVDYLQIVDAPGKEERLRLTRVSKGLRMLAKSEDIAVVGLSQMPRPLHQNLNKRPTKFDLKESGSLENDSHTVLLIYRPVDGQDQYTREDEIIIGKQRSGETGIENVIYRGKHMRFYPREAVSH